MSARAVQLILACVLSCCAVPSVRGQERRVEVADDAGLRKALSDAKPGTRVVIAPGKYRGDLYARDLRGSADAPVVIEAADPKEKPVIEGGRVGMHLSDAAHVTLRNLVVRGQSGGGINVDDGGTFDTPAHHVTIENVDVADIGPKGNLDGVKLSGVDDLVVRNCTVEGWGGEGIDMVGCHRVLIEACTFRGKTGFSQSSAVQAKGASANVVVRRCNFVNAGERGVNLGGSTGVKFFRPPGATYEAKDITVEGCRFTGGLSPINFVGVDGAVVRYNTIYQPGKWVVRILQETTAPGFVPSRGGRFERNLIVYGGDRVREPINVGPRTEPGSFVFRENFWFREDRPASSRPKTPTAEEGGVYGVDPEIAVAEKSAPGSAKAGAARGYGADALPKE